MSNPQEDDLLPSTTPGYKPGEKKTIEEYAQLDQNDESLKKWKESLGLSTAVATNPSDPRRVVVLQLAMEVSGRPDVALDLSTPEAIQKSSSSPITIKEGVEYRMKIKFKIQNDVVSGLKYLQAVKRMGVRVDKTEEMIGSYGPNPEPYERKFQLEEAPSGMLARGHYDVKSKFVDDDGFVHMEWDWSFDIKKDW